VKYVYVSGTPNIQDGVARAGTPARLLGVAGGLRNAGAEIAFVLDDQAQFGPGSPRAFDVHLVHAANYRDTAWMSRYVTALVPDAFVCAYPDVIATLGPLLSDAGILVVYDIHDDDAKVAETLGEPAVQIEAYRSTQLRAIQHADVMWVSTEHERDLAERAATSSQAVFFVPNGSPDELLNADCFSKKGDLLFVGNGHYPPNARAVSDLADVLQLSSSDHSMNAKLRIVGQGYDELVPSPRIDVRGFVSSLSEGVRGTSIGLAPLLTGAGAKMKVRDYCAAGIPVLSTTEGALGLPVCEGVVIEDRLSRWPSLITTLFASPIRLAAMSKANREMISESLSWRAIGADANARMQRVKPRSSTRQVSNTGRLRAPRWIQDNKIVLGATARLAKRDKPVVFPRNSS
jgi:glycosyltransferase involved in cell wall biosynthesis